MHIKGIGFLRQFLILILLLPILGTACLLIDYVLPGGFASGKDLLVGVNALTGKITTVIRATDLVASRSIPAP